MQSLLELIYESHPFWVWLAIGGSLSGARGPDRVGLPAVAGRFGRRGGGADALA